MSDETIELNWQNLWPVVTGNETTVHRATNEFQPYHSSFRIHISLKINHIYGYLNALM